MTAPFTEPSAPTPLDASTAAAEARCVSCEAAVHDHYCGRCGERRASERRYTLRAFAGEAFEAFTSADSTLWRTLRTLVTRPGELTRAYVQGRRVTYMRPLQLFLIVNVVYFLWATWAGERVFDTPLSVHLRNTNYGEWATRLMQQRLAERRITQEAFNDLFNLTASVQARTLIIVMVPMYAALVGLLQLRRRRLAVQHLVFALHAYTVFLLCSILQRYVVQYPMRWWYLRDGVRLTSAEIQAINARADQVIVMAMLAAIGTYGVIALRRAYGDGLPWAIVKGAILAGGTVAILGVYRFVLFYAAWWTT